MNKFLNFSNVLIGLILLFSLPLWGRTDPSIDWNTIETEHFEVVYDSQYLGLGKRYAKYAEMAYELLFPVYGDAPSGKIVVLLSDTTDVPNGRASFFPYPHIVLFPILPNSTDSIGHYDSWGMLLMVHELGHIFTFHPAHGFYTILKYIFGSVIHPNALLPLWYQEGLSVELETWFTKFGRLRSPAYSSKIRALALNDSLKSETIDRINESSIPTWPYGERPYLFGSLLWDDLVRRNGLESIKPINQRFSRRLPFMLEAPITEAIQMNYPTQLSTLYNKLQVKAEKQIANIQKDQNKIFHSLDYPGARQRKPSISPNGEYLVYFSANERHKIELRIVHRKDTSTSFKGLKHKTLMTPRGTTKISWLPDSSGFIFDKIDTYKRYYSYRDIYLFKINTGEITQLTFGQRTQEPSLSSNGKEIVFIKNDADQTQIVLFNLKTKKQKIIFKPKSEIRLSYPHFYKKNSLLFIGRNRRGKQYLYRLNLTSRKLKRIQKRIQDIKSLNVTPQGLLYISAKSGIDNLYFLEKLSSYPKALTNTLTSINSAALDSFTDQLLVSQLSHQGEMLFVASDFMKKENPTHTPSLVDPTVPSTKVFTDTSKKAHTAMSPLTLPSLLKPDSYSSWPYLLPRYWIPFVYPLEGGVYIQGSTSASDPLEKHAYFIDGSYDSLTEKFSYGVAYINRTTPLDVTVGYAETNELLTGGDFVIHTEQINSLVSTPVWGLSNHWTTGLGWIQSETDLLSSQAKRAGPQVFFKYYDIPNPKFGYYSENGQSLSMSYANFLESSDQISYNRLSFDYSFLLESILPYKQHLLGHLRTAFAPDLPEDAALILFGDKTIGANFQANLINSSFLLRGYPSGEFIGKKMVNWNLTYSFPLASIYKGRNTLPLFFKNMNAHLFVDGLSFEGFRYSQKIEKYDFTEMDEVYWSAGAEFTLSTSLAYQFPVTFLLGLYYGFDKDSGGGFTPFMGFGIDQEFL